MEPSTRFPVVSSPVDSSLVDSTQSVHPADGSSHGQFNTGRFIPECEKSNILAVGAVLAGFLRRSHTTLVGLICAFVRWMSAFEELATATPQHQDMDE